MVPNNFAQIARSVLFSAGLPSPRAAFSIRKTGVIKARSELLARMKQDAIGHPTSAVGRENLELIPVHAVYRTKIAVCLLPRSNGCVENNGLRFDLQRLAHMRTAIPLAAQDTVY